MIVQKVLMVAAENGGLAGGKVGGMGDVIRDVPPALAKQGVHVDVVNPGYQHFSNLENAQKVDEITVRFGLGEEVVSVYRIDERCDGKVVFWALEHPLFACGGAGKIYCDDPSDRPFASDASKFALFCAAICKWLSSDAQPTPDVIHLHDWHSALVRVLAEYEPEFQNLRSCHWVYTIHNLALQGIRPLSGDASSLAAWFPGLAYDSDKLNDPRYPHCFNPMRAGINLCDRIHAVSPTYAREILLPSDPAIGFVGGEGLSLDLQNAATENRLVGILNGCEYPELAVEVDFNEFLVAAKQQLLQWGGDNHPINSAHWVALQSLEYWSKCPAPGFIATSVGRLTAQKVSLLQQLLPDGRSGLEALLTALPEDSVVLILGSGDTDYEDFFTVEAAKTKRLLFLKGYSEVIAEQLYRLGDLFLMPSSFEPCGISQMLAMRAAQPCLVHAVGGLVDTVADKRNGFVFSANSPAGQVQAMLTSLSEAIEIRQQQPHKWQEIVAAAAAERFTWSAAVAQYISQLYR